MLEQIEAVEGVLKEIGRCTVLRVYNKIDLSGEEAKLFIQSPMFLIVFMSAHSG
jgi:GTP-binding protein HflX